jgi:GGDEF domain-containing protein
MEKGKVHEEETLDAGRELPVGSPLGWEAGERRRREDRASDVPRDQPGDGIGTTDHSELVAEAVDWLWLQGDADGLRSSGLLESETGHYTSLGIDRRLRELVALSQRNDEPLTCVVFGVDRVAEGAHVRKEALIEAAERFGALLRRQTRRTDVVGRLEPLKYIVLAPRTPPFGGLRLAERFTSASLSWFSNGESPVTFGAGVAGVEGCGAGLESCPDSLLAAAERALIDARVAGAAQIAVAWLGA